MIDAIASFSSPSMSVLVADIAFRHSLRRGSGRWSGPCPKCGGSARSDKFVIKEDGGFKCYACDFKGDIVTWLREMEGKSCAEAHEIAGLPCLSHTCAVRGTCRFGDGSGRRSVPSRRSVAPPQTQVHSLPVCSGTSPLPQWIAFDLGRARSVAGLEYLPRADGGNGSLMQGQVFVGDTPAPTGAPAAQISLPVYRAGERQTVRFPPRSGRYFVTRLTTLRYVLCAAPAYLEGHAPIRSRDDLPAHRYVDYVQDYLLSDSLRYLDELGLAPHRRFAATGMLAQYEAVRAGLGLGMLAYYLLQPPCDVVPVLDGTVWVERTLWLVAPADLFRLRRVRVVWDHIRAIAEAEPALFVPAA